MKKSYLMIAAAAALFAACAENDVFNDVDTQDVAIGFDSKYLEKSTRAEITNAWLTTNGSNFGVYGFRYTAGHAKEIQLFNNEEVSYVAATPDWVHTTVRYWDKAADDEYFFYAYAPYSSTAASFNRTVISPATTTGLTYNLGTQVFADASVSATVDLCVARVEETDYNECYYPTTSNASDGHVSFTFNHVLSKLVYSVKSEGFATTPVAHTVQLRAINVAYPTATGATWKQTALSNDAGKVTYTGWTNPDIDLTDPNDLASINIEVFADNDNVTTNDVNVTTTATLIDGAKSYIVTPNAIAAAPADQEKHKIYLEVEYDINYHDDDTNPTIDSQTAYGSVEIQFEQNYVYNLIVNIKPAKIEFDVDAVQGFTPANPALNPVDVQ